MRVPLSVQFPIGYRKHRLTVIGPAVNRKIPCKCDCGNLRNIAASQFRKPNAFSCGCYANELTRARHLTHNDSSTKFYQRWNGMVRRCTAPNHKSYAYYGGRGIKVCIEWLDYPTFKKWAMTNGFQEHLRLERKDNDGDYCPENCYWSTQEEQMNNQRGNRFITYHGKTQTVAQWGRELGISRGVLGTRLWQGWSEEKALSTPLVYRNKRNQPSRRLL